MVWITRHRLESVACGAATELLISTAGGTTLKKLAIVSLFAFSAMAAEMTGYISDAKCGAKGSSEAHAKCAENCVKGGSAAVFVSDGKVYKIDSDDQAKVADHVGHKVTIDGKIDGDTIKVDSVKM
jgi:hypothetical protein